MYFPAYIVSVRYVNYTFTILDADYVDGFNSWNM